MKKRALSLLLGSMLAFSCLSVIGCDKDKLKEANDAWFEEATKNQRELEELEERLDKLK